MRNFFGRVAFVGAVQVVFLAIGPGCDRDRPAWDVTQRENSLHGYEQFLREHPGSRYAPDAESRIGGFYCSVDEVKLLKDGPEVAVIVSVQISDAKSTVLASSNEARLILKDGRSAQPVGFITPGYAPATVTRVKGGFQLVIEHGQFALKSLGEEGSTMNIGEEYMGKKPAVSSGTCTFGLLFAGAQGSEARNLVLRTGQLNAAGRPPCTRLEVPKVN